MELKSYLFTIFPKFCSMVEKHVKTPLVTIYFDGGDEYKGLKSIF